MGPTGSWFAVAPIVLQIHQLFSNTQHELLKSMCEHRTLSFINITFCISTCVQLVLWCKFVVSICRFIVQPWFYLVVNICFSAICYHYDDVIMSTIASQITSLTIVYSLVYPGADQSKHQSSASLAFAWGIHRGPVNSPHKWPVTRKMFPWRHHDIFYCWHWYSSPSTANNTLQCRHDGRDGVSNYQHRDCLLNRLFGCGSKKTSTLSVIGIFVHVTVEFPAQMASNAENVFIWWRHHE